MKYSRMYTSQSPFKTKARSKHVKIVKALLKKFFWSDGNEKPEVVYSLPGHALPTQFRSVLPVTASDGETLLRLERTSRRIRHVTTALASLLLLIIIVIIALIITLQISLPEESKESQRLLLQTSSKLVNITKFKQTEIKVLKSQASIKTSHNQAIDLDQSHQSLGSDQASYLHSSQGMRCYLRCFEYTAFRFKSACINGYCRCQDNSYDDVTCLPKIDGCKIHKHDDHRAFSAKHLGSSQPLYTCAREAMSSSGSNRGEGRSDQDSNLPEIHVISVFQSRRSATTSVHVTSRLKVNVTLVLVTYDPITWNVKVGRNTNVKNIVLIANHKVSLSHATMSKLESEQDIHYTLPKPSSTSLSPSSSSSSSFGAEASKPSSPLSSPLSPSTSTLSSSSSSSSLSSSPSAVNSNDVLQYNVMRLLTKTGYGDDRLSGSTPSLLNFVTREFGTISSFVGTAQADFIKYNIEPEYGQLASGDFTR